MVKNGLRCSVHYGAQYTNISGMRWEETGKNMKNSKPLKVFQESDQPRDHGALMCNGIQIAHYSGAMLQHFRSDIVSSGTNK